MVSGTLCSFRAHGSVGGGQPFTGDKWNKYFLQKLMVTINGTEVAKYEPREPDTTSGTVAVSWSSTPFPDGSNATIVVTAQGLLERVDEDDRSPTSGQVVEYKTVTTTATSTVKIVNKGLVLGTAIVAKSTIDEYAPPATDLGPAGVPATSARIEDLADAAFLGMKHTRVGPKPAVTAPKAPIGEGLKSATAVLGCTHGSSFPAYLTAHTDGSAGVDYKMDPGFVSGKISDRPNLPFPYPRGPSLVVLWACATVERTNIWPKAFGILSADGTSHANKAYAGFEVCVWSLTTERGGKRRGLDEYAGMIMGQLKGGTLIAGAIKSTEDKMLASNRKGRPALMKVVGDPAARLRGLHGSNPGASTWFRFSVVTNP